MDECKVCGRKNPVEGANFCFYCGASLRDNGEDDNALLASGRSRGYGTDGSDENGRMPGYARWTDSSEQGDANTERRYGNAYDSRSVYGNRGAAAYGDANSADRGDTPVISRWKMLGLLMLLLLPVYGWLFLVGWAIINVVSSRSTASQKEIAHGMLMFFATAIVLIVLVSAYLNAHPEIMDEYNRMYQQMMGSSGT